MSTKTVVTWAGLWAASLFGMMGGWSCGRISIVDREAAIWGAVIVAGLNFLLCLIGALAHELHRRKLPAA
jgi:hypothetical protein